jgi:hypothetical protein
MAGPQPRLEHWGWEMPRIALLIVLGLAACSASDAAQPNSSPPPDMTGWRLLSGKPPTKEEFAAVLATCQDKLKTSGQPPIDACLGEFGLRHVP